MNKSTKLFLSLLVALILSNSFLLGFIYPNIQTTINGDKSGSIVVDVGLSSQLVLVIESTIKQVLWKEVRKNLPKEIRLQTYQEGDLVHYKTFANFNNIDSPKFKMPKTKKTVSSGIHLKTEDKLFLITYKFSQKLDLKPAWKRYLPKNLPPQVSQVLEATKITYRLTMPGEITKANTKDVVGSSAAWQIEVGKPTELQATSRIIRWRAVLLFGTLAIVSLGLVGAVIIKARVQREKQQEEEVDQNT